MSKIKIMNTLNIIIISLIVTGISACFTSTKQQTAASIGDLKPIKLLKPQMDIGKPLMQVLKERKTERSFSTKKLPDQMLSNLLWAAFGINRPDSGKRTAPSAVNWQEIDIYVALEEGLFIYSAEAHSLNPVLAQDIRKETIQALQPLGFSVEDAPVQIIYVANGDKRNMLDVFTNASEEDLYAAADTGFICENVYLFCASEGLGTVVRGMVDRDKLHGIIKLGPKQKVVLAQSVGYPNE
jgi:SagB-type dehydrogenase family enzyme